MSFPSAFGYFWLEIIRDETERCDDKVLVFSIAGSIKKWGFTKHCDTLEQPPMSYIRNGSQMWRRYEVY